VGELASAIDALAAEDLHGLPAPSLLERTAQLVAARNRIDAELARTARRADLAEAAEHDEQKSMASWLRGHARLSSAAAFHLVRAGRILEQLPEVAAGFAAGLISADQVAVIAPVARPENLAKAAEQDIDLTEIDRTLADVAATRPHDQLRQVVQHYLTRLDHDGPEPDPTEQRSLTLVRHADGSISGRFDADAVGGEKEKDHPHPTTRKLVAGPWGWPYAPSNSATP
jgi:Domain of unknown function (DUF222)